MTGTVEETFTIPRKPLFNQSRQDSRHDEGVARALPINMTETARSTHKIRRKTHISQPKQHIRHDEGIIDASPADALLVSCTTGSVDQRVESSRVSQSSHTWKKSRQWYNASIASIRGRKVKSSSKPSLLSKLGAICKRSWSWTSAGMSKIGGPFKRFWDWIPPRAKWRKTMVLWLILESIVFALHLVASLKLVDGDYGLTRLRYIPCNKMKTWELWVIALPVNIVASLMVAGSNYARQVLLAPSRDDLDKQPYQSWDIGFSSAHNLRRVHWLKHLAWWGLSLASVCLHIMYNSLFIVVPTTYDAYQVVISRAAFLEGVPINLSSVTWDSTSTSKRMGFEHGPTYRAYLDTFPGLSDLETSILDLQNGSKSGSEWHNLSPKACTEYYRSKFYGKYESVLVMVNETETFAQNNSALFLGALAGASYGYQALLDYCPPEFLVANQYNFSTPGYYWFKDDLSELCQSYVSDTLQHEYWTPSSGMKIHQCISREAKEECTIVTSILFWRIITGLLGIQVLGIGVTLMLSRNAPMLTVGDSLSSLLKEPAPLCPTPSKKEYSGAETGGLLVVLLIIVYLWFLVALGMGTTESLKPGLKVPDASDHTWLFILVLWTNFIQILTAMVQYLENIFISMAFALYELQSYTYKRRGLRMTQPLGGAQRSSYLLSLPLWIAVELVVWNVLLHWWIAVLLSVSIVFVVPVGSTTPYVQATNRSASGLADLVSKFLEILKELLGPTRSTKAQGGELLILVFVILPFILLSIPLMMHSAIICAHMGTAPRSKVSAERLEHLKSTDSGVLGFACRPSEDEGDISEKEIMFGVPIMQERDAQATFTSQEIHKDEPDSETQSQASDSETDGDTQSTNSLQVNDGEFRVSNDATESLRTIREESYTLRSDEFELEDLESG